MNKTVAGPFLWMYWIVSIVAVAVLGLGIYLAISERSWSMLAAGCIGVVASLIAWSLALQLRAMHAANVQRAEKALATINERFEQFSIMLNLISEQQLLSDRAKAVAFREKDSDALRRAIQEEILKQDWEAAESLANEMASSFGYKQEAERLRKQIAQKRQEVTAKQIAEAVATIDRHARNENWAEAIKEAQRIAQLFPDQPSATSLPGEVEARRAAQKKQLIESWHDALARHDVDGGIEILKRLDSYLTPAEAETFQESARTLFKEKISSLRTQFSAAVQEHNWSQALRLAETIVSEFPHTQMAREVREMMDTLRARASGVEPAAV